MTRMSRRGFLTVGRKPPAPRVGAAIPPTAATPQTAAPAKTFLEDFYANRARTANPALVYEPTTFVWDEAWLASIKRKGDA